MDDTNKTIASKFFQLMMEKSEEERFLMGCSMYEAARKIAESAILNQNPRITPEKLKEAIFLRFYGGDFTQTQRNKFLNILRKKK